MLLKYIIILMFTVLLYHNCLHTCLNILEIYILITKYNSYNLFKVF